MDKKKVKVYTYTRVSTTMQIDGYSLDAQKSRMKAFAEYNDYEIVREYEDAGKSGKSIEGRVQFSQMMDDIKEGKDGVSYVLVFKLSRFGRNAADVLSTLQIMQDFGVNLICVEDGIDSSKDAGKLMISVLSAVAEIERENIRVQTMEGRIQKAREGKWNGGFAPYGYQLVDGKLEINEEEAVAIRVIFDQYVNTNIGSNGIAKYLENHGIRKIQRQNGKNPLFDAHLVRLILRNPVYCGKIAYGRRRTEKVHGTRNDYHLVEQENYLLVDGLHEAIVSEEIWQAAQVKLLAQAKKYEHVNKGKDTRTHLLSGIVKCPVCGAGMYGNKCIKHKKDGTKYKDFYYYGCKHRTMTRGHKCDYRKQINEELLDDAVAEIIVALVSKPKFAMMMQEKINMKVDTSTIDQEVANHEKQLRQYYSTKSKLMEEIDSLDPDDRHYIKRKADLDDRLYRMYDKIEEEENLLVEARAKKQAIEAEKLTADNIYKVLIYFEKLYGVMNDVERRRFIEALISEIQIFPERQPNGQWLKSIKFKLPIIGENMELSLDNDKHVERYTATVNRLEQDAFSTRIIRTIKMSDAQQWIISLFEEGKSTGTIKTILAVVKPAFQMACEEDAILKNPFQFKLTNYIPNNRKQRTALTDIQQKNLLAYMESSTVYSKHLDLFIVLLWTGLRVSEYCGLTVDDIDFDLMRIRVERQLIYGKNGVNYIAKPKTAQGTRYIPITQKTYASLQRLVRSSQQNHVISVVDGYSGFIALKRSGKLQARYDIEHVFHDLRRAYNRDNPDKQIHTLSPHVLRHTFCTNMANAGMDVKNLQYIMGHADVSMTLNVYTHATYTHASAQMLKLVNSDGKTSICGA